VTGGALPAGLTLGTDGTFTGTPSVSGTFDFTVKVTDSFLPADTLTKALSLQVSAAASSVSQGPPSVDNGGACSSG